MEPASTYALISVVIVSLVSFVGVISLSFRKRNLNKYLLILVSLSAGTLFGGALFHLLPESVDEQGGFTLFISLMALLGIIVFFVVEKFVHWHHSRKQKDHLHEHLHSHAYHLAPVNLMGDALHNFIDGLVIAGSYFISVPVGVAATIAVVLHEIPQEIADFGVLLYSGLPRWKAILFNFLSALVAVLGAIVGITLGARSEVFLSGVIPFAAGGFIYIAGSNLIPELHKECGFKESMFHLVALLAGLGIMFGLLFLK